MKLTNYQQALIRVLLERIRDNMKNEEKWEGKDGIFRISTNESLLFTFQLDDKEELDNIIFELGGE